MNQSKVIEPQVREILRDYPETRDNYLLLVFKYWEAQGLKLTPEQMAIVPKLVPSESLTRACRKIWEGGDYLPSLEVQKDRHQKAEEYRQEMVKKTIVFKDNVAYITEEVVA